MLHPSTPSEHAVKSINALAIALGLSVASLTSFAQVPAGAPAGSTGQCKDGSYTTHDTKKGACSGHKGVKEWFGDKEGAAPAKATATAATGTATTTATAPAPAAAPKPAAAPSKSTPAAAPATGGGPGQVWVNTETKVYHCAGSKWYGKTKQGEYMPEAAAKAAGSHADHGKACAS